MFSIIPKNFPLFLILVIVTILSAYYVPSQISVIWYILLLVTYYKSKDEPFWLAFFLVTTDGFMGFLGLYAVTLKLLPGLPGIELVQFYVLLSVIKAIRKPFQYNIFYLKYLKILFAYFIFRIIWGQMMGFSGELNDYFRILKSTLPIFLFFSIPRLFADYKSYERFFHYAFIILLFAFSSQILTLITGFTPQTITPVMHEEITEGDFRTLYNIAFILLGFFGALFFLPGNNSFNKTQLFIIIFLSFAMTFLSATRGWIIGFGFVLFFSLLFLFNTSFLKLLTYILLAFIIASMGLTNSKIHKQVNYSIERISTLETLYEGDITASGTLARLDERSPRVLEKWKENPVFGWGVSDISREYGDGHVGNQNLLLSSGIIGFLLLYGFFIYFMRKMFLIYLRLNKLNPLKKQSLIFIIFFTGWIIIHSTSGQQFGYGGLPVNIIPQAIFFSFGALIYAKSKELIYAQKYRKSTFIMY